MSYAPGIEEFVNRCNAAMAPDSFKLPLEKQRALYQNLMVEFPYQIPVDVNWFECNDHYKNLNVRFRMYTPQNVDGAGCVLYIRGGGFVMGSLDSHHSVAAEMASNTKLKVVAVDFRLAPEHPFPSALEDCYATLLYLCENKVTMGIDNAKIIVAGDSSGANMAVVLAMMCRDRNGPRLAGQALISPVLDFTRWRLGGKDAPLLTGGEMEFYTACYSPDPAALADPYVSPLIGGNFDKLPRAYIMGAEKDSLVSDAEEYARLLRTHGGEVELVIEQGLVHSAIRARSLSPSVQDAWTRYCLKIAEMVRAPI